MYQYDETNNSFAPVSLRLRYIFKYLFIVLFNNHYFVLHYNWNNEKKKKKFYKKKYIEKC